MAPCKKTVSSKKAGTRKHITYSKKLRLLKRIASRKPSVTSKLSAARKAAVARKIAAARKIAVARENAAAQENAAGRKTAVGRKKKTATGKVAAGLKKGRSKSPPKPPPRPRVLCPGCSTELALHKTLSTTEAFVYATTNDMKWLKIECENKCCILYIEGLEPVDKNMPVSPAVEDCMNKAQEERARVQAAEKDEKKESEKKLRKEKKAHYAANYDPFSKMRQLQTTMAIIRHEQRQKEAKKAVKRWWKTEKDAAKLERTVQRVAEAAERRNVVQTNETT